MNGKKGIVANQEKIGNFKNSVAYYFYFVIYKIKALVLPVSQSNLGVGLKFTFQIKRLCGNSLFFSSVFFLFQLDNAISKDAQCLCQRMSLNNRATIAESRRVCHEACIRLSKCACGKTDGDAASPNKKIYKNPLRGQSDRAAEFPHPHRAPGANGAELLIEGKNCNTLKHG